MTSSILRSTGSSDKKARGYLLGLRVVVPNEEDSVRIYSLGFYGKPFGVRKPGPREYREVLELSFVEALYLCEQGFLEVVDENNNVITCTELLEKGKKRISNFELLYKVYKDLRSKGFVVRSGLKFGSDYSLYRQGPGVDHAPFLVHVFKKGDRIDPIEIVRAGRLSHSVKKKFIMAVVDGNNVSYVYFEWFRP